jgi:hypothetical protein
MRELGLSDNIASANANLGNPNHVLFVVLGSEDIPQH